MDGPVSVQCQHQHISRSICVQVCVKNYKNISKICLTFKTMKFHSLSRVTLTDAYSTDYYDTPYPGLIMKVKYKTVCTIFMFDHVGHVFGLIALTHGSKNMSFHE